MDPAPSICLEDAGLERRCVVKDEEIKIKIRDGKIITLKDLFKGKQETRVRMANLPFEKKVNMLISLQETARFWGGMKDVLVWKP